jgi:RNA polymerase sigma-70 factor (ECF subfamily)
MNVPREADPESLLLSIKQGATEDLGTLLEMHRNYLALIVRLQAGRQLSAKLDPEDILQETFLEAHRGVSRFRGSTQREFLAWLRRIVAGVLANQLRRYLGTSSRDVRLETALHDDLDRSSQALAGRLVAPQSSPSRQAVRKEEAVMLADALESLPADYRDVIILRQLEDLPFPEVARRMGRSVDSVKNLWVRALGRLRRGMGDQP